MCDIIVDEGGGFLLASMKKIFRWILIYLLLVIGLFLILVGILYHSQEVKIGLKITFIHTI